MNYNEILQAARTCMGPYCKACPVCDGKACRNTIPGPGSKGLGVTFQRNYQKWQELCVQMDTICDNRPADTSFDFFGAKLRLPVLAAPVGAMKMHYGDKYDDAAYNDLLVASGGQSNNQYPENLDPDLMDEKKIIEEAPGLIQAQLDLWRSE